MKKVEQTLETPEKQQRYQIPVNVQENERNESIENRGAITKSRIQAFPSELDQRFDIKDKFNATRYYHKGSSQEAFRDKGKMIIVKPESTKMVATDIVKLADSKGWTDIKVTGRESFRKEVWREANLRGIEVTGYKPTEQDKRDLDKRLNSIEAAPRHNQSEKENSKIAPKVTAGTIGDTKSQNPESSTYTDKRKSLEEAYNTKPKEEALKKHPELKQLYKLETAAHQFADNTIDHPKSREQFISNVRDKGLDELSKGNSLPTPKSQATQPQQDKGQSLGR